MKLVSGFTKKEIEEMKRMFLEDGIENIGQLEEHFQVLEADPTAKEPLVDTYRILHSFKGMAGTIGLSNFEKFFHTYESLISSMQEGKISITKSAINLFFKSLDFIEEGLNYVKTNKSLDGYFDPILQEILKVRTGSQEDQEDLEKKLRMKKLFEEQGLEDFTENKLDLDDPDKKIYLITITYEKNIRLKVARLFVIIRLMSKIGTIRQTFPEFYDLLEGRFDDEFSIIFQSKKHAGDVKEEILNSGELRNVDVEEISSDKAMELLNPKEEVREEISDSVDKKQTVSTTLSNVKVSLTDLDRLMEFFGELLIRSKQLEKELEDAQNSQVNEILFEMQNYMFNLQDIVLQIQMVPISIAFRIFPRMVRSISRRQQKRVNLTINHHDVKVDRKILNDLGDILNHIIRNAVSHGIEKESVRAKEGKAIAGKIQIDTTVQNNVLNIKVQDDGRGIDLDAIRAKAFKQGIYSRSELESKTEREILEIIFEPNFSTSKVLDKISGRGLGLNIVKQKVEALGGSISVSSVLGEGSTFNIQLPLARTLIRALLVESAGQIFSIPLEDINELMDISANEITEINAQKYVFLPESNQSVRIFELNKIFQLDSKTYKADQRLNLVHIKKGVKNFALIVDRFVKESEIVIKKIENFGRDIKGISGAAILEDGSVSLIIDAFTIVTT